MASCNVYEPKHINTQKGKQKHIRPFHIQLRKRKRTISESETDPLCLSTGDTILDSNTDLTPLNLELTTEPINPKDPLNLDSQSNNKKKKGNTNTSDSGAVDEDIQGFEPMETLVASKEQQMAVTKNKPVYIYGNYPRYYGYRNSEFSKDPRLEFFKSKLFENKKCLDIGCNSGAITIKIARDFAPLYIEGIDIDSELIKKARKSLKFSLSKNNGDYPISLYGSVTKNRPEVGKFPQNLNFRTENYVLSSDQLMESYLPEISYDVILCLSVTKWVHLNWGDEGLKRMFRRIYKDLGEEGVLILECQEFSGYSKRSKLSPHMREHFKSLKLLPDKFSEFLLSEVGFMRREVLGRPPHESKGFQRQIEMYRKGEVVSNS